MEKEKKILINRRQIKIIIPIVLVLGIIACGFISIVLQNEEYNKDYENANNLYKKGDYKNSIIEYKKLNDYKDSKSKLTDSYYMYGKLLIEKKKYEESLKILDNCNNTKKCRELIKESQYQIAISNIENNEELSIGTLKKMNPYKESQKYIDEYNYNHKYEGTYEGDEYISNIGGQSNYSGRFKIIKRTSLNRIEIYDCTKSSGCSLDKKETICNDDYSVCKQIVNDNFENSTFTYEFSNDSILETGNSTYVDGSVLNYTLISKKTTDSTKIFETPKKIPSYSSPKKDPKIGMTKSEVEKSTWGKPDDINKSTYSWGTTEQWVYEEKDYNNKYIYFEDGIVTSISE